MSSPLEGIHKAEARSSIEIKNSCNNCIPICGKKTKHHKRKELKSASDHVEVLKDGPIPRIDASTDLTDKTFKHEFRDKNTTHK